jgi:phage tail-like protein
MPGARLSVDGGDSILDTEYDNLVLMWGVTSDMALYDWFADSANGDLLKKNLSVVLMDDEGLDAARWNFIEAWPTMYDAPDLNAMEIGVAIETLEISFERMERVE